MEVHTFSLIADLAVELAVDSSQHIFLVSCSNLRQVSPVWMKSLDPDTKFAQLPVISVNGRDYRKITVEDFGLSNLVTFFNIIHYKPSKVPQTITLDELKQFALLADQYLCAHVLSPWTRPWIDHRLSLRKDDCPEDWLFIGTVFADIPGCSAVVEDVSKQIITDAIMVHSEELGEDLFKDTEELGEELFKDSEDFSFYRWAKNDDHETILKDGPREIVDLDSPDLIAIKMDLIPQKILDFIVEEQETAVSKILMGVHGFVREMLDTSLHQSSLESHSRCLIPDCFSMALGSLIVSIRERNLDWLLDEPFGFREAPLRDLVECLDMLRMKTMTTLVSVHHYKRYTTEEYKTLLFGHGWLSNQKDHATVESPCGLAVELDSLQKHAQTIFQGIKGYKRAIVVIDD